MLEMLRQRRWLGFTAFVLLMMALCVVLARWQWGRYQQRSAENAQLDAAIGAPAVPIDDLLRPGAAGPGAPPLPPELAWRAVTASGHFDAARQVAVRRRPLEGRTGFWIVVPLVTPEGSILVNRGWTAATGDALAAPDVAPPPSGEVVVTGRLRPAEPGDPRDAPPGQAWAIDPETLLQPSSEPRYPAYIEMRASQPPADEGLVELPDPGHRGLNNLVYSVQWLLFAGVGALGWWRLLRQESLHARAGS